MTKSFHKTYFARKTTVNYPIASRIAKYNYPNILCKDTPFGSARINNLVFIFQEYSTREYAYHASGAIRFAIEPYSLIQSANKS
jgi:hypothetical protein